IEESIGGVEDSARKFGPEDVLDALVAEVNNRSDSDGVKRLNQALMAHARPLMVQEVEDLCANDADFYRNKLPSLFQFLSMLIGKTQDKQEGDAVHQDDVAQQEEAPGALSEEERIILPCISSILFARNRLLNRFQMLVGVLLAVSDTPDMVKGFLHHCGMTVSQPTIRSTLESISDMAVPNAKELFADKNRIKVFLFDNINIYMRRAALRLTDFNTAAALTMCTIYTLSSSCLPSDFTEGHIRQLRDADRALLTVEDIVPDGDFLEQAGIIHIAQSLMGCAQFQPRQQSAVLRRLEELRRLHTIDILEPERADTSRSSHHVLDRLEDRLSAVAEQARVVKQSIAKGWNVPLFHRNKTTKADQIDIAQIKRVSVDTHLFSIFAGRTIGPSSRAEEGGATARKETAKAAARKDAEHEVGSFQLADPLMRGYIKLRKGALGKWQGRNSGMEIRQLLLETLAEDDEADYDALTSGADDGQAAAAGSRVVERYRRDRGAVRMEELWEESNGVHDE
ncbi:unnamed protein product, partial [Tilletia controversa]